MVTGSDEAAWVAAGLYDPSVPDARERRDLLEFLARDGATVDEMLEAEVSGTLRFLAADRVRWGGAGPTLTLREVAERAGVDLEFARRLTRAVGLADPGDGPAFAPDDVQLFEVAAGAAALFGEERLLEFTRVLGSAVARIAEVANSVFVRGGVESGDRGSGGVKSLADQARDGAVAMESLMAAVPLTVVPLLRHHFQASIARYDVGRIAGGGDEIPLAVGFVDLVRSTELLVGSGEMPAALDAFFRAADEAVVERRGRIVKTIGDAVMFVCLDAPAGADVALALLDLAAADDRLAGARAGLSSGLVTHREADYFGPVVNLAARLVGEAPAGSLLVDAGTAERLSDAEFVTTDAGAFTPKGFDTPVPLRQVMRR